MIFADICTVFQHFVDRVHGKLYSAAGAYSLSVHVANNIRQRLSVCVFCEHPLHERSLRRVNDVFLVGANAIPENHVSVEKCVAGVILHSAPDIAGEILAVKLGHALKYCFHQPGFRRIVRRRLSNQVNAAARFANHLFGNYQLDFIAPEPVGFPENKHGRLDFVDLRQHELILWAGIRSSRNCGV